MQIYYEDIVKRMKKRIKTIIGRAAIVMIGVIVIVGSIYIAVYQDRATISIIGGADGPTAIFIAGTVPRRRLWKMGQQTFRNWTRQRMR